MPMSFMPTSSPPASSSTLPHPLSLLLHPPLHLLARSLLPLHPNSALPLQCPNQGFLQWLNPLNALLVFSFLLSSSISPDPFSFSLSFTATARAFSLSQPGKLISALEVFYAMDDDEKNLISWNSMIGGCARFLNRIGMMDEALELFDKMQKRDVIAWDSVLEGYMDIGNVELGLCLFDEMLERDVISKNIMINGYVKNGMISEALFVFMKMQVEGGIVPDGTILVTALFAISELGCTSLRLCIHKYIRMKHLSMYGKLDVVLIDMYSKCGYLGEALQLFKTSSIQIVDH
ncbi:pentatricopeptide repeat-containing protein At2g45350, chloroplastic-like [Dioscorea cayenensis subsp. rotundata]|uniref:Pentatricopeptide repeat-containing protein At2g45350, chloroplastic-like n=1 Tax=Dioscorea cayennensis subsp. rotundata TaxID=55577 RepID=A0AB40BWN5_DIOCR|nr:pentatricopeptide repeat-containing protein At2g45350, chloroplastic-like [Dioscorea cayenensis subsp. rotundata]